MSFIEGYDPFAGVPEEVEDRISEMLDSVEACTTDADLIHDRNRASIRRHLEDWGDRSIDFGFGETRSMRR
jgi:hypothetical protein